MSKKHRKRASIPNRIIVAGLLVLIQIGFFIVVERTMSSAAVVLYRAVELLALILIFMIINKRGNPNYKMAWIVFIIAAPFVGGVLFFLWGNGRVKPILTKRLAKMKKHYRRLLTQNREVSEYLEQQDIMHSRQSQFLYRESGYPVYTDTKVEFYSPGEEFFPKMLEELESAQKYIFLEYFILVKGEMWNKIYDILRRKAAAGVEVRIIFDDFGSITRQGHNFVKKMRADGIKVIAFNKIRASVDLLLNNRDHRKICVIDGYVSMTGGMNIADEYINIDSPHGYWLDSAVILRGAATTSFVVAFCEMWSSVSRERMNAAKYVVRDFPKCPGFVQPYMENPLDTNHYPAEGIYRQILNTARDYVYIMSPYLILDNTMITAVTSAAKAGIDVRIITPKIKDKWYVHPVTRFNYQELLEAGVRIFEFTPGFIHSKVFVSDDAVATCGTVNMDYRSFYFHFECGSWFCGIETVTEMRDHFLAVQAVSEEIKLEAWKKRPLHRKFGQALLNVFAPFM